MKRLLVAAPVLAILAFSFTAVGDVNSLFLTPNTSLNVAIVNQIVNWIDAGLSLWTILGMVVTGNAISIGILLTAKTLLKTLTKGVVIAW